MLQPLAWLSAAKPSTTSLRPPQKPPSPRRWLAGHALRLLLAVLGTAFATSCADQEAILLMIRPPAGVTLAEYEVKIQDRTQEPRQLIYQSGIQPVAAVAQDRDLATNPLKIGLKLSKAGTFLIHVRASTTKLAPEGTTPKPRTPEFFFATLIKSAGTTEIDASLLEVSPEMDQDFDHFPSAAAWTQANLMARVRYQSQLLVLDCVDADPKAGEPALPARLYAVDFNPLAKQRCGLPIDTACGDMAPACQDKDKDGEDESTDCDDNDAQRFHGNARPRNCCECKDRASCATNHNKLADQGACMPPRCNSTTDYDCMGQVVSCFVDEDCDGYSPMDPVVSQRDCDDTNPDIHPGAKKRCDDITKDWACDGNPAGGCVACDLDGDGYQRLDPASNCPDKNKPAGQPLDCDDFDRGVFPGSTAYEGATLTVRDLKGQEGGGSVAAAMRRLCANKSGSGADQDADCNGMAKNGCPPVTAGGKTCDVDGDGFPNANAGCNPYSVPLDCNDADPQTFPGAPDKCGDAKAQNCVTDRPCTMDGDGDGYNSDVDCNDADPAKHPFATEVCDGEDNDCDGLIDEQNPDDKGVPMIETHVVATKTVQSVLSCTDNKQGLCGRIDAATGGFTGHCVCSGVKPGPHAANNQRKACPGTRDDSVTAPKCFGAQQPGLQTCVASQVTDEDCDGRTDAPDGMNLKEYGEVCGVETGECVAGTVAGCNRSQVNSFSITKGHMVFPAFNEERRFLTCDATAAYPSTDVCDMKDNDCNNVVDDCSGPGIVTPRCCKNVPMCLDTDSNFDYCGSCSLACDLTTASQCKGGQCQCGNNPACSGATPLCLGGNKCVECVANADCKNPAAPVCDPGSNKCVECTTADKTACTGATPACDDASKTCVECTTADKGYCMGATPACDGALLKCVECTGLDKGACVGATPACDTMTDKCVQCTTLDTAACSGATGVCDNALKKCVQCTPLQKAACVGMTSVCDAAKDICVQCSTDDKTACVGMTNKCDLNIGRCAQCYADDKTNCIGTTDVCDLTRDKCVQCTAADKTNCIGTKQACDLVPGVCVECTAADAAGCPMATPACNTTTLKCVQCTAGDKNACVGTTKACNTTSNLCVECTAADKAGCPATTPACNTANSTCVQCSAGDEMYCSDMNKACNTTTHLCVECTAANKAFCPATTPACNTTNNTCVECSTGDDKFCTDNGKTCDTTNHVCI